MSTNQWMIFIDEKNVRKLYYCKRCRKSIAEMTYRFMPNGSDSRDTHKEYRITCPKCGRSGSLHWSRNLAEFGWSAENKK